MKMKRLKDNQTKSGWSDKMELKINHVINNALGDKTN